MGLLVSVDPGESVSALLSSFPLTLPLADSKALAAEDPPSELTHFTS